MSSWITAVPTQLRILLSNTLVGGAGFGDPNGVTLPMEGAKPLVSYRKKPNIFGFFVQTTLWPRRRSDELWMLLKATRALF